MPSNMNFTNKIPHMSRAIMLAPDIIHTLMFIPGLCWSSFDWHKLHILNASLTGTNCLYHYFLNYFLMLQLIWDVAWQSKLVLLHLQLPAHWLNASLTGTNCQVWCGCDLDSIEVHHLLWCLWGFRVILAWLTPWPLIMSSCLCLSILSLPAESRLFGSGCR